jgi:predicted ATPase
MGGIGKTRLALQVATDVLAHYKDGVWFADLAALSDPTLVPQTVASVLGIREEPSRAPIETLIRYSKTRQQLLVLDNCEHLIEACAALADTLLGTCSELRLIATSRELLRIPGETVFVVPSLSVCDPRQLSCIANIMQYEAVQLFVDRAAAVQPSFAITSLNTQALAELCYRLDGMPLAIELAASRIRVFSPTELNEHLKDRFRLLTAGSRTALPRQQTLRATIDWSYDLLSEMERLLLRRVAVFRRSWTLEAAEEVCAGGDLKQGDVVELLAHLVEKSLVLCQEQADKKRHRLLETVLTYAEEKLFQSGEVEAIRERHCNWALKVAEHAHDKLQSSDQGIWLDELERWIGDLRFALEWAFESDRSAVLRLAAALGTFWFNRSYFGEGIHWLKKILSTSDSPQYQRERAKVLPAATGLTRACGDYASAHSFGEQSLDINRKLGDRRGVAISLVNLGMVARDQGEYRLAKGFLTEALQAFKELDDQNRMAYSLNELGVVALREGAYGDARAFLNDSLLLARQLGNTRLVAVIVSGLGDVHLALGNHSLADSRYKESLRSLSALGDKLGIAFGLDCLAQLAAKKNRSARAARLYAAAQALRHTIGVPVQLHLRTEYELAISKLRDALSEEDFAQIWIDGCAMTSEQAIAYALDEALSPFEQLKNCTAALPTPDTPVPKKSQQVRGTRF